MKQKPIETLLQEHAELERESLPMIEEISERSKHALNLQVEIFKFRFKAHFLESKQTEAVLLTTFSARSKPSKFEELLAALQSKNVKVSHIIYDAANFAFHLYGRAE